MESTIEMKKEDEHSNEEFSGFTTITTTTTTATTTDKQQSLLLLDSLRNATDLSEQEQCFTNLIKYMKELSIRDGDDTIMMIQQYPPKAWKP